MRYLPEMQMWDNPVGEDIQSHYFRTTATNREIRRGFFEYEISDCRNKLVCAKLLLEENRAWTATPFPEDHHNLSYFHGSLSSHKTDFEREVTNIFCFTTDPNEEEMRSWTVDVTSSVKNSNGKITFRVSLNNDVEINITDGSAGSGFMQPKLILEY